MSDKKQYAQRDIESLEPHYWTHLSAMTGEQLYSKSDIAAELAFRDARIAELTEALEDQLTAPEIEDHPALNKNEKNTHTPYSGEWADTREGS